jgi:hypothetical protein
MDREQEPSPETQETARPVRVSLEAWEQLERIGAACGCAGAELATDLLEAICCKIGTQAVLHRDGLHIIVPSFTLGIPTITHHSDEATRLRRRADALEGEFVPL